MDVLFSVEERVSKPMVNKPEIVRYGDSLVLETCASREPAFLAIVRNTTSKRSPSVLPIEAAAAGRYPNTDYLWTFAPAAGTKKKRGDPVSFGDRLRIQTFDYTGNYRHLAMIPPDVRYPVHARQPVDQIFGVVAEKTPGGCGTSTWSMASAARLRTEPGGRVLPDGDLKLDVEFGEGYIALLGSARYLSLCPPPYRGLLNSVGTLPDLPPNGMAVWWRVQRSLADARPSR